MIVLTFAECNVDQRGSENNRKRLVIGWRSANTLFYWSTDASIKRFLTPLRKGNSEGTKRFSVNNHYFIISI